MPLTGGLVALADDPTVARAVAPAFARAVTAAVATLKVPDKERDKVLKQLLKHFQH